MLFIQAFKVFQYKYHYPVYEDREAEPETRLSVLLKDLKQARCEPEITSRLSEFSFSTTVPRESISLFTSTGLLFLIPYHVFISFKILKVHK